MLCYISAMFAQMEISHISQASILALIFTIIEGAFFAWVLRLAYT